MKRGLLMLLFALVMVAMQPCNAWAAYVVNRSFSDGVKTATLTGSIDIALGNYVIQNNSGSPFTSVNLVLTVGSTSYNVNNVSTQLILGTGVFNIAATATELIFDFSGNGGNPADLGFFETNGFGNRYYIGSNGNPAFEVAYTAAGDVLANPGPRFPVVFGRQAAVPEPASLAAWSLLGVVGLGLVWRRKRRAA